LSHRNQLARRVRPRARRQRPAATIAATSSGRATAS